MKKLIILFSFVLLGLNLSSQIDSSKYYFEKAYNSSDYKFQIVNYTKFLRLNPDDADAYYNRGNTYGKLGKYQLAIDDYNRAIRINPDYAIAYNNRGIAYNDLGKYQLAIDDYNNAIRINPDDADAYYNRGNAYNDLGKYQLAIDDYNRAIRIKPDYANAYNNRGTAKWYLKLDYCSDYKKACDLGECHNYNKLCK